MHSDYLTIFDGATSTARQLSRFTGSILDGHSTAPQPSGVVSGSTALPCTVEMAKASIYMYGGGECIPPSEASSVALSPPPPPDASVGNLSAVEEPTGALLPPPPSTVTLQTSSLNNAATVDDDVTIKLTGASSSSGPHVCASGMPERSTRTCLIAHADLGDLVSIEVAVTGEILRPTPACL